MWFFEQRFTCESPSPTITKGVHHNLTKRLQEVVKANNGYQFIQHNGQRIFAPCPYMNMDPPQKGCEIFIGNIPKFMYEDQLIPLFQSVGKLYKFRLMLDFQQHTRGYGFAAYLNPNHVREAIAKFDGYQLNGGTKLAVYKSLDNRRLFLGNIPKDKTREDLFTMFSDKLDGVVDVILYPSWQDKCRNRGFAFVEFESHSQASMARRQLHPRNLIVWEHAIYVDWAEPIPEVNPDVMAQVKVLYIKNLPYEWNHLTTQNALTSLVGTNLIEKTHKINTFAFVHCKSRKCAEIVKTALNNLKCMNHIEVEWARPPQYSTKVRSLQTPDNFCLSVPKHTRKIVKEMAKARWLVSETFDTESKASSPCCSTECSFRISI